MVETVVEGDALVVRMKRDVVSSYFWVVVADDLQCTRDFATVQQHADGSATGAGLDAVLEGVRGL